MEGARIHRFVVFRRRRRRRRRCRCFRRRRQCTRIVSGFVMDHIQRIVQATERRRRRKGRIARQTQEHAVQVLRADAPQWRCCQLLIRTLLFPRRIPRLQPPPQFATALGAIGLGALLVLPHERLLPELVRQLPSELGVFLEARVLASRKVDRHDRFDVRDRLLCFGGCIVYIVFSCCVVCLPLR